MKIMFYIEKDNKSKLSYKIKCTYGTVKKNVEQLVKNNILYVDDKNKKNKKAKKYALTEKGKKIKDSLITINRELYFIKRVEGY